MEGWLSLCYIALATLLALWFLPKLSGGKSKPAKKLPPGPWTLPIIGSLHHMDIALPHRKIMELCRRHGPLMHLMLGEVSTVVVSSAEAASLVMKTNDVVFASRPCNPSQNLVGSGGKGIIFAPYGERWRQMRKICIVELLSAKQVRRMEGIRAKEVGSLLRSIAAAAPTVDDVGAMLSAVSNDVVARAAFGGKFTKQEEYLHVVETVNNFLGGFCLADLFPSSRLVRWLSSGERNIRVGCERLKRIVGDIIDGRKAERAADGRRAVSSTDEEDLLDVLLRLQEDDSLAFPLTSEIIGAVIFDIFGAATETTGTTLTWALSELLKKPETMAKAQLEVREVLGKDRAVITTDDLNELHYMRMVIKEVLRLHPPAPFLIPRKTREDCEIMGYNIPQGTDIFVNVFAISRDEKYWDSPAEFRPERFEINNIDYYGTNFELTPFGAGRRLCPGILFATRTMEIVLANLLYHFDWLLPDGSSAESLDMSEKFGITVRRKFPLKLTAVPHPHSKAISI